MECIAQWLSSNLVILLGNKPMTLLDKHDIVKQYYGDTLSGTQDLKTN